MMKTETVTLSEDGRWEHGVTTYYQADGVTVDRISNWVRMSDAYHAKACWFLNEPKDVFASIGLDISEENAKYLQKIFMEDWVNGVYYIAAATDELKESAQDIAKLIINDLSALANERENTIRRLFHPVSLNQLFKMIFRDNTFDKRFFKEIVEQLCDDVDISVVLENPKYVRTEKSKIKAVIAQVVNEHLDKIDGSDKINNWLIGQVMKALKGAVSPAEVKAELPIQIAIATA